jgi:nucleotide-binding universal stress UspA family protein
VRPPLIVPAARAILPPASKKAEKGRMSDLYVVGVDGSEGSRRALYVAAQAAHRVGARLLVAHVVAGSPGADLTPVAPEVEYGRQEH